MTRGRWCIRPTATVSSAASRTPRMREFSPPHHMTVHPSAYYVVFFFPLRVTVCVINAAAVSAVQLLFLLMPLIKALWLPVSPLCLCRNKAILFYFNMLKCANPAVLINLQCPTTQVRGRLSPPPPTPLCAPRQACFDYA